MQKRKFGFIVQMGLRLIIALLFTGVLLSCGSGDNKSDRMQALPSSKNFNTATTLRMLSDAIKEDDEDDHLYYLRSKIFFDASYELSALNDINKAIELNDERADYYFWKAFLLTNAGNYRLAQNELAEAEKLGMEGYEFYNLRGLIYLKLNMYKQAFDALNISINKAPFYASSYIYRGIVYNVMGDTVRAIANFEKAIYYQVNLPETYFYLSETFLAQKRIKESIEMLNKGIRYDSTNYLLNYQKGNILYSQHLPDSAARYYKIAVEQKPSLYEAEYGLGMIALNNKNYPEAEQYFQRVLKFKENYKDSYYNLAVCYEKTGKMNFAIDLLDKVIKKDSTAFDAQKMLERINLQMKRDSIAHSHYKNDTL